MSNFLTYVNTAIVWATQPKDLYCERTVAGFFGEPYNLISSLLFLWPAFLAFKSGSKLFSTLFTVIAASSMLYHSYANELTYIMDVSAIMTAIVIYYVRFFMEVGVRTPWAIGGVVCYIGFLLMSMQALPLEYSYYGVLPLMAAQFTVLFSKKLKLDYLKCLFGVGFFCLALASRFLDHEICSSFPQGAHWLWHTFNTLTLVMLIPCLQVSQRLPIAKVCHSKSR